MKRHTFVPLIALFPVATLADDPFACVDRDVFEAFLGSRFEGPAEYSTSLPPGMADLTLPASFELVGSKTTASEVTIVYRSGQDEDAAVTSGVDELEDAGWQEKVGDAYPHRGFQVVWMPKMAWMCRESGPGALMLSAREDSARTLLSITLHPEQSTGECRGAGPRRLHGEVELSNYLPILRVPDNAQVDSNSEEGGGDEYSADAVLSTTLSRDALLEHFADQLPEQGWVPDAAWSGRTIAGTQWTRSDSRDRPVTGTLRVAQASAEVFHVRFTVSSLDSVIPGEFFDGHDSGVVAGRP